MSRVTPVLDQTEALRSHLMKLLEWSDAHVDFDSAVAGIPPELRGKQPEGLPYSPWQLLEHMRIAQRDILEFCRAPSYQQLRWPDDYWPRNAAPPSEEAWEESVNGFHADRLALKRMIADPALDLFAQVPRGEGQTYLREALLAADHNAYHLGELVAVRRLLGAWK